MTDEGEVSSADQDAWLDITRRVRVELEKRIPEMGAMKPDELKTFIDTLNQAIWMNEQSCELDKKIEIELARLPYGQNQ
jgi:hypothetical protein